MMKLSLRKGGINDEFLVMFVRNDEIHAAWQVIEQTVLKYVNQHGAEILIDDCLRWLMTNSGSILDKLRGTLKRLENDEIRQ